MICSCGARYPDSDEACTYCGAKNAEYKPPEPVQQPAAESNTEAGQPYNPWDAFPGKQPKEQSEQSSNPQTPSHPPWQQQDYGQRLQEELFHLANSAANISVICGILGNIIAGPIFGTIAIFQGRKAKRLGYPGGKATAGIVLGVIAIIFWLFAMIMLFYVFPRVAPQLIPQILPYFAIGNAIGN